MLVDVSLIWVIQAMRDASRNDVSMKVVVVVMVCDYGWLHVVERCVRICEV